MIPITIILGPTAVGKTRLAIEMALRENGEIISADSGQIYRGLDIGTAKPPLEERQGIPFHLIDILDPSGRFSAAGFRRLALRQIEEGRGRGRGAIVVGGTGLYIKVLEEGIFEGPAADPEIRKKLEERCRRDGVETLLRELAKVDPVAANKMDKRNRQRIIRALEVYELTGRPISEFWVTPPDLPPLGVRGGPGGRYRKIGLTLPREELNRRIGERIDRMIAQGWIDETETLLEKWGAAAPGLTLIGYKELVGYLQGRISRETAIDLIKTRTRQYAKRQMTWFKADPEIKWS